MDKKIGKEASKLLFGDLIYILTSVFINTFLVSYLLQVTNDNITKVATYYITVHIIRFIGALVIGRSIKRYPNICKQVLSLSAIIRAFFILLIVALNKNMVYYYIFVAGVYAVSEVLYWGTHELMYISLTNNSNRSNFITIKKVLGQAINIVVPAILGASIELVSFNKIAVYVFILSILQIGATLSIKNSQILRDNKKYSMAEFRAKIKKEKLVDITRFARASVFYGAFEKTASKIIIVITMMTFKTSMSLGILTTVFALCSMIAIMIYNKLDKRRSNKHIFIILAILIILSVIGLLLNINKTTLIIYNLCYMIGLGIYDVVYNIKKGNIVVDNKIEKYKEEYVAYVTAAISMGRIIGYILMLIAGILNDLIFFKLLLILITVAIPLFTGSLLKLEKYTEERRK